MVEWSTRTICRYSISLSCSSTCCVTVLNRRRYEALNLVGLFDKLFCPSSGSLGTEKGALGYATVCGKVLLRSPRYNDERSRPAHCSDAHWTSSCLAAHRIDAKETGRLSAGTDGEQGRSVGGLLRTACSDDERRGCVHIYLILYRTLEIICITSVTGNCGARHPGRSERD